MNYTKKLVEMKDKCGLTNQQIADKSGVPVGTVSRVLAGQTDDPNFSTVANIVLAMGGSLDELVGIAPKQMTVVETKTIEADEKLIALYEKTIKDKNKWIVVLFSILSVLLAGVIALFAYDFTHPDRGWYQEETLRALASLFTW